MRDRFDQILEGFVRGDLDAESRPLIYGFSMRVGEEDGVAMVGEEVRQHHWCEPGRREGAAARAPD